VGPAGQTGVSCASPRTSASASLAAAGRRRAPLPTASLQAGPHLRQRIGQRRIEPVVEGDGDRGQGGDGDGLGDRQSLAQRHAKQRRVAAERVAADQHRAQPEQARLGEGEQLAQQKTPLLGKAAVARGAGSGKPLQTPPQSAYIESVGDGRLWR
jgi:hypothetical protein